MSDSGAPHGDGHLGDGRCSGGRYDGTYLVVTSVDDRLASLDSLLAAAAMAQRLGGELLVAHTTRYLGLGAAVGLVPPNLVDDALRAQRNSVADRVATLLALTGVPWRLVSTGGSRRVLRRVIAERPALVVIDVRPRRRRSRRQAQTVATLPAPTRPTDITY
jgi:hypothetical protein